MSWRVYWGSKDLDGNLFPVPFDREVESDGRFAAWSLVRHLRETRWGWLSLPLSLVRHLCELIFAAGRATSSKRWAVWQAQFQFQFYPTNSLPHRWGLHRYFALNMTWTHCEVYWDLDFEPFENEWRAASGIRGLRCLVWRLFFGLGFDWYNNSSVL